MNIEDIVREGKVTAVDNDKLIAKVWFDDLEIESDWMPVLINRAIIEDYPYDVPQWTDFISNRGCQRSTIWYWCCTSLCSAGMGLCWEV